MRNLLTWILHKNEAKRTGCDRVGSKRNDDIQHKQGRDDREIASSQPNRRVAAWRLRDFDGAVLSQHVGWVPSDDRGISTTKATHWLRLAWWRVLVV